MQRETKSPRRLLVVLGTRPEAIKLFPVIHALQGMAHVRTRVCVTGQHRDLLDPMMRHAGIIADIDLDLMVPGQSLDALTGRLILALGAVFDAERPDRIIVQGDTATAMAASLTAYYRRIPVAHVEAGLRSGDLNHPWPEEVNRRVISLVSDMHFAPTQSAADALIGEGICGTTVHVTGNTVVDALLTMQERFGKEPILVSPITMLKARFADRRIIAVTSHRRENLGAGMAQIAMALREIAARDDVAIIFPVHPNPQVRGPMERALSGLTNVALVDPFDYPDFVALLAACHLVLTDSGGIQEEAPAFGKPVLVMRETTERPEGVAAGTARLVGTDPARIVAELTRLLDDDDAYGAMALAHSPYGDGQAAPRIASIVASSG
jgi:UDP-N-acetylglucosamine 2-epimerase (non-hydrolysing)